MQYKNRKEGGQKLAQLLQKYANNPKAIILGLPRGGVVTAAEVAKKLNIPLDITCPRKIGAPFNPELAVGAITESGEGVYNEDVLNLTGADAAYLRMEIEKEKNIATSRLKKYRKNREPRNLQGKIVILIDDGIATGATMHAALKTVKSEGAAKIIVAVPVAPLETAEKFSKLADEWVCPYTPEMFYAVGQFYEDFRQTEDDEVEQILNEFIPAS